MKNFRATFIFASIVVAVVGFAIWESRRAAKEVEEKTRAGQILPGFNIENLRKFRVVGRSPYALERQDLQWQIIEPVQDLADSGEFSDYIKDLVTQQVEALEIEGRAIPWAQYGLTQPEVVFEFELSDGRRERIEVGSVQTLERGYYLRKNGEESIYVGSASWQNLVSRTHGDWENKRLILPQTAPIGLDYRLEGGSEFQLEYKDGFWINAKNSDMKIDQLAVAEYVASVRDLRAAQVFADPKAQAEVEKTITKKMESRRALMLVLKFKDEKPISIQARPLSAGGVLLTSTSMKAFFKITDSDFVKFNKSIEDLRDKSFPFRFDISAAKAIEISPKNKKFVKKENLWVDEADHSKKLVSSQVELAIYKVSDLKVKAFGGQTPWPSGAVETIRILSGDQAELLKLEFVAQGQGTDYWARTNKSDEIFRLAKAEVDAIMDLNFYETEKKP